MQVKFSPFRSLALLIILHTGVTEALINHPTPFAHKLHRSLSIASTIGELSRSRSKPLRMSLDPEISNKNSRMLVSNDGDAPLLTVGVLADIQYAPIPDGFSYGGKARYYQHALEVARHAAQHFEREKVDLVLNLGDIVDGKCQEIARNGGTPLSTERDVGEQCIQHVMDALSYYTQGIILHSYGNHCLYNMDRLSLQAKLGIPFVREPCGDLVGYHSYLQNRVRFVLLDSYDIALMRRCETNSQKRQIAVDIMRSNNPNFPKLENSPEGLEGLAKRFVAFNGGVGPLQLQWLRDTLEQSRRNQETVIILSHQPILPGSSNPVCLIWNFNDVLRILRDFRDVVAASFSGHAHKGGYRRDEESGIHFRVIEAALENPHPHKTYAMLKIFPQHLELQGYGNCESAVYELDHLL